MYIQNESNKKTSEHTLVEREDDFFASLSKSDTAMCLLTRGPSKVAAVGTVKENNFRGIEEVCYSNACLISRRRL
jgi:hypothetical protein